MAQSNTAYALQTLGQWCRSHGIYELRDVLAKAAHLAAGAESSELLAQALEEAAIAADVVVCPAPAKPDSRQHAEESEGSGAASKARRRARAEADHLGGDDQ